MGKGGGSNTTETNTVAEPWKGAQPFLKDILGGAQSAFSGGQFDVSPWPGMRVAPQSTMTQTGQQQAFNTATGGNPFMGGAQDIFGQMAAGPDAGLGGLGTSQDMLSAFSGESTAPQLAQMKENVLADVLPAVSSRFANSGMLDSSMAADTMSRSAAEAVAPIEYGAWNQAQNRGLQAFQTAAPMEQQAYEAARGRQMGAMGMAPDMTRGQYIDPIMLQSFGGQLDQHQQQLLDAAMSQWYEQADRPFQELQKASSIGMGMGGMGGTSTSQQEQPGGGPLSTIGSIAQIAAPLVTMFSDRRLKTGIECVGETAEGYPKYRFRYLWDVPGTVRIGVMADEVPEEITAIGPGGYMMVNYARVTL